VIDVLEQHRPEIAALCRRFGVKRLELFGSAARGDFNSATSDFDFLVEFQDLGLENPSTQYFGLLHGLEDLLHRRIDLVERDAVENRHFLEVADRHRDSLYAA
jgi:predicted nucleotidyltransferase